MKLIYVLSSLILFACSTSKELKENNVENTIQEKTQTDKVPFNTQITITHYNPYCGGAAPDDYTLEHLNSYQTNTNFILLNLISGEKSQVKTDSAGVLYLNLSKGNFAIREIFKDCTFEEFQLKNPPPQGLYYLSSPDANCYKNWWASNLGEIHVSNIDSLQVHYWGTSSGCFTGNNPCIYYTGPMPP